MSANIINSHLTNIISSDRKRNAFSDSAKVASIQKLQVSQHSKLIFKSLRKIHTENLTLSVTKFISDFISAYRKEYSTNYVLLRLIENWKTALDTNLLTGAVLMDLSKAFDCIPHDLLIAKLHAYEFSFQTLTFLNSYLKVISATKLVFAIKYR